MIAEVITAADSGLSNSVAETSYVNVKLLSLAILFSDTNSGIAGTLGIWKFIPSKTKALS